MSTTKVETIIDQETALRSEKAELQAELRALATERRRATADADAATAKPYREALSEAKAVLARREQEAVFATGALKRLEDQLATGNDAVTAADLTAADNTIKRTRLLVPSAKADALKAERALRPFLADNHLAHLAADVIEELTDAPVLVYKRAEDATALSPSVILSQVTPTIGYGKIDPSGEVKVTLVGEPKLDWRHVAQALEDRGCEATISDTSIRFIQAAWPLPHLVAPEGHAIATFAIDLMRAWHHLVEVNQDAVALSGFGYQFHSSAFGTGLDALSKRVSETLTCDEGKAIGTVKVLLSVQRHSGGETITTDDIEADVTHIVRHLGSDSVGNVTEAGKITGVSLIAIERSDGSIWDGPVTYGASGHALYPATVEVEVQVEYHYEPVQMVVND